jgi:hypothetical protein
MWGPADGVVQAHAAAHDRPAAGERAGERVAELGLHRGAAGFLVRYQDTLRYVMTQLVKHGPPPQQLCFILRSQSCTEVF